MHHRFIVVLAAAFGARAAAQEIAAPPDVPVRAVHVGVDSGIVSNNGDTLTIIYSEEIHAPKSEWIRLEFGDVLLSGRPDTANESLLVITSLEDGAVQYLNARTVEEWSHTSAYFNGDAVLVEIVSAPGTGPNRVEILAAAAGEPVQLEDRSICGLVDDRVLSTEARDARYLPAFCTAWLIDNRCFLSAGHCVSSPGVIQFNVPLSTGGGSPRNPGPEDQYAVDAVSMQSTNGGIGNDWAYFGCFDNSNTGLSPFEAQGDTYSLATTAPAVSGQTIRITGFGSTSSPVSPTWNLVQKTHTGPYVLRSGTVIRYATDTSGGNSGSAVFNETSGLAIGIHTNAGCSANGGSNQGTSVDNAGLKNALANPQGICRFADCNNNGLNDFDEIGNGLETDCNNNNVLDSCEIADGSVQDCNGNGLPDSCDIASGFSDDCNTNGIPDDCEIADGSADDCNENGILDECDLTPAVFTEASPNLQPIGFGFSQAYTFVGVPDATENVTLSFQARGDFDAATERVTVMVGGGVVGFVFETGTSCPISFNIDSIIVPAANWNAAIDGSGDVEVRMIASSAVNADACGAGTFINVQATYGAAAPFEDLNGNSIPDVCENACIADLTTTGAAQGDPGFGVPDGQVTGTDLNFYVNAWVAGDLAIADLTTTGAAQGDPGFGVPDGQLTGADLNFYVNAWIAGCP